MQPLSIYWQERVRTLAAAALASTPETRLAEWRGLERADAASAADELTTRQVADHAIRARRYWRVCQAASQGDLCGAIILNPGAASREAIEAELQQLLGCATARGAFVAALNFVAVSFFWRRLVVVRPQVEEELRSGRFALGDLRDCVRSGVHLRLRVEATGGLTAVEHRIAVVAAGGFGDDGDGSGLVDAACAKGAARRFERRRAALARAAGHQHQQQQQQQQQQPSLGGSGSEADDDVGSELAPAFGGEGAAVAALLPAAPSPGPFLLPGLSLNVEDPQMSSALIDGIVDMVDYDADGGGSR
jgi:hypothetical protein